MRMKVPVPAQVPKLWVARRVMVEFIEIESLTQGAGEEIVQKMSQVF